MCRTTEPIQGSDSGKDWRLIVQESSVLWHAPPFLRRATCYRSDGWGMCRNLRGVPEESRFEHLQNGPNPQVGRS